MAGKRFFSSFLIFLSASFVCAVSVAAFTEETDETAALQRPRLGSQRKIFTNEDLQRPESETGVSAFLDPPQVDAAPPRAKEHLAADSGKTRIELEPYVKEADPRWYSEQMDSLRAELENINSKVQQLREFRKDGKGMTGGLTLDQPSLRLTPENEIEQLTLRREELEFRLAELEDTARRKGFPPGLLRASPSESSLFTAPRPEIHMISSEVKELKKEREQIESRLTDDRSQLEFARKDLDLLQREQFLSAQQFYSNPDYTSDGSGRARLSDVEAHLASTRDAVNASEQRISELEDNLKTLDRALGPKEKPPLTPEQEKAAWQEKLRPPREELAQLEGALKGMEKEAATRAITLYPVTNGGSPTSDLVRRLSARAAELQRQIDAIEDEARRADVPPGWLR
jgi:chromosome segregation ATPase